MMRRQGTIVEWNVTQGFGFVLHDDGDERAFAHVSDFTDRQARPSVGDLVTYDEVIQLGRREASAIVHVPGGSAPAHSMHPVRADRDRQASGGRWLAAVVFSVILAVAVILAW